MENEDLMDISDNLLGLGSIEKEVSKVAPRFGVTATPKVVRLVRSIASKRAKKVAHNKNLTRGQAIFAQKVNELPTQAVRDLKSGNAQIVDGERYIAAQASGDSGTQELLQSAPNATIGITNLDEGKMPSNASMLLEGIKVEMANDAGTDADDVSYSNIFDAGDLPSAFQNGELEIQADGRVVVPSTPMSKFFTVGGTAMTGAEGARVVMLKAPKMLPAGSKLSINWRKPTNGSLSAANNDFIKVTLIGSETATR